MIIYRGDLIESFEIKPWKRSRYGFHALFFTTDLQLARMYAIHHAQEAGKPGAGAVHQAEVHDFYVYPYDFQGKHSYGAEFRNLMHTLQQFQHKALIINNVIDYPKQSMIRYEPTDVVVILDLEIITNLKCIETNIWQA